MASYYISVLFVHPFLLSEDTASITRNVRVCSREERPQVDGLQESQSVVSKQMSCLSFGMLWGSKSMQYPTYLPYTFKFKISSSKYFFQTEQPDSEVLKSLT